MWGDCLEENLLFLIESLIESKREDEWWDFKREHHKDKADLVHDITCMANSRANRDSYIIFGVEDKTFNIVGVEEDDKRRTQQNIVDLLKSVHYAGSVRPRIELRTIRVEDHEVDVLIIKNSNEVPYYLEKKYFDGNVKNNQGKPSGKIVLPYHIYTRVVDNNTAVNENADLNDIEYLWRKRFGIDRAPKERLMILLDEIDKWFFDWGNKTYAYHNDYPEFNIELGGRFRQGREPSALFYTHTTFYYASLNLKFHDTILYETELWCFDEYRKFLPKADTTRVVNRGEFWYSYYVLDSIEGKLLRLFTRGTLDLSSREPYCNQLLVFKNEVEKESFDCFLEKHFDDYSDDIIYNQYKSQIDEDNNRMFKNRYSAFQVAKCARIFEDWKNTCQMEES